ncbi:MAG: transcriptional regulator [Gammaproteobacteria bacterium]|jgi:ArsR family transcriptional regulator|nr:transcriptional regulator [Gammaproteobacteria bacterium]
MVWTGGVVLADVLLGKARMPDMVTSPRCIDEKTFWQPNLKFFLRLASHTRGAMTEIDRFFYSLMDQSRLRCLLLLLVEEEISAGDMTQALGLVQSKVSWHLGALRAEGLVLDHREAQRVFYRLHPTLPPWMREILLICQRELADQEPFRGDRTALTQLVTRHHRHAKT